jgi:hypothetical protein
MQTSLLAIANKAKDRKHYRFLNLYRLIGDENFLLDCWSDIRQERRLRRRSRLRPAVRREPD